MSFRDAEIFHYEDSDKSRMEETAVRILSNCDVEITCGNRTA
jgi:hypothetical protein